MEILFEVAREIHIVPSKNLYQRQVANKGDLHFAFAVRKQHLRQEALRKDSQFSQ